MINTICALVLDADIDDSRCSKSHNRGKLICIEGGNVAIGTLIAYWYVSPV